MDIQKIWKEVKSFKKDLQIADFQNLVSKLGYKELAYKNSTDKEGIITRRKFLLLNSSGRMETIVLGKTYNILSIVSK